MNRTVLLDPDWSILGVSNADGVMVIASRTLSQAQLRYVVSDPEPDWTFETVVASRVRHYEFETTMGSVFIAYGATYGEALATVLREWSPDGPAAVSGLPVPVAGLPHA